MSITLRADELAQTLETAYLLAIGPRELTPVWTKRAEQLAQSPSVGFIAAVGAVLLAKATNPAIDPFVIQAGEGSAGAFNLRAPATALASKKRAFGYDIGSSSDRDPINHGTLISSTRWDLALDRIRDDHKPFFQMILTWLPDVSRMDQDEAGEALAAYIRIRRSVRAKASIQQIPAALVNAPALTDLVDVLDGFVAAEPEGGARGMALAAAAYRAAGFEAAFLSPTDPRRIDIAIKRAGSTVIGAEVKQVNTRESTADTLSVDAAGARLSRALLVVLRPGVLVDFNRAATIRRAEKEHNVVLRVVQGTRELLHEALSSGDVALSELCADMPRLFAEALRDIRATEQSLATWAAIACRWADPTG